MNFKFFKKSVMIICVLVLGAFIIGCDQSQVPPVWEGDCQIKTSSDIKKMSEFTTIDGNLKIEGASLTNLQGLENLTTIKGSLYIRYNSSMTGLEGLQGITRISGSAYITNNPVLASLNGLRNCSFLGSLWLQENDAISDLNGLQNLAVLNYLWIEQNDNLSSIAILNRVRNLEHVIIILSPALMSLEGLNNLGSMSGDLWLESLPGADFSPLSSVSSIGGSLRISYCNSLVDLASLSGLTSVGTSCSIRNNASLVSLNGLNNLSNIKFGLYIEDNPALESIDALAGLGTGDAENPGSIEIVNNDALSALTGLNNITGTLGSIEIANNDALESCAGLGNVEYIPSLKIYDNAALTVLGLDTLCSVGSSSGDRRFDYRITNNILLCEGLALELQARLEECGGIAQDTVIDISGNKDCQ
ncbi:MAG: hypothetical protein GY754_08260 [bacterium]|nr:hypothetical protein [bacterium]